MFPFKPNPAYVPGGVNNFWVSGHGGPPAGGAENSAGGGGGDEQVAKLPGGAGIRSVCSRQQHEQYSKEPLFVKFGGLTENFAPFVNNYNTWGGFTPSM